MERCVPEQAPGVPDPGSDRGARVARAGGERSEGVDGSQGHRRVELRQ